MKLLHHALAIARMDAAMLGRFPRLSIAVVGAILAPALYALIYLESVWDPASRTEALPAIIVNLDAGTQAYGRHVDLGSELTRSLQEKRAFGFTLKDDEAQARREVRAGRSLFALIVPRDFSASAMSGDSPGGGKLVLFASEGNNFMGAGFARRFAVELGHQVNETLNEKRWALVLGAAAGSGENLARFRTGMARLQAGSKLQALGLARASEASSALAAGSGELADGVHQLVEGMKQVGGGARTLAARQPAVTELDALRSGASQLAAGHAELGRGLEELAGGSGRLEEGASRLRDESLSVLFIGDRLAGAAGQLADGAAQLSAGIRAASQAEVALAEGSQRVGAGVAALTDGVAALGSGLSTLAARVPADERVDRLSASSRTVADGAQRLSGGLDELRAGSRDLSMGLDLLAGSLPVSVETISGTARGLAASVEPDIQIDAPVANDGAGFAPSFLPVSLWLGAVTLGFLFNLRQLPTTAARYSRWACLLGRFLVPAGIVVAQAIVVLMMATLALDIHAANPVGLALTLVVASLTFMLITLALVRAFGDAGKALASILLILQLSSAGGIIPIELTSPFFRDLNPWLPFTWVVRAVQASMFGAFDSEWVSALGIVAMTAIAAFVLAALFGRWRFVAPEQHRPAIEI